ncbi:outer membrane protein [Helicobacter pylori]|nr:outer membrane protein [Helicobacter pylori]
MLGGSYVQATAPNIANTINESLPSNNLYPQNYPSNPSPSNSNNPYAQYYPPSSSFPNNSNNLYPQSYPSSPSSSNSNNSNTVSLPGGTGGLFSEISFGYKYFLGKKRIIGFRHSLFFGYQVSKLAYAPIASLIALSPLSLPAFSSISYSDIGSIAFLPYGFNTDLLINFIALKRASQESGRTLDANALERALRRVFREDSLGLVIGMDIGASTWFSSNNLYPFSSINLTPFNQVKSRTIFQLQGKFGIRWNYDTDKGGSSVELGVKVPAFGVSDNTLRRWMSVYLNYTYNFKNKH